MSQTAEFTNKLVSRWIFFNYSDPSYNDYFELYFKVEAETMSPIFDSKGRIGGNMFLWFVRDEWT